MAERNLEEVQWAFDAYEAVRHRLPQASFPSKTKQVANLAALADQFDVFLLDAFGVLNIGESAIPGAPERLRDLQAAGKTILIVSNAAGYPKRVMLEKYRSLGFDLGADNVLSSRQVILRRLHAATACRRGLMISRQFGLEELEDLNAVVLAEDPEDYDSVDEFVFFGAAEWTEERQALLETSLKANPRPVKVGNPDIVAPRENGLSREPGHFAHRLVETTGVTPEFFGKPFNNIFEMAISQVAPAVDLSRMVMVGDTLQTDILGGAAAGVKTALITGYGSLTGLDIDHAIAQSGISPDYVMPTT